MTMVTIWPTGSGLSGQAGVPYSKPHTQRAILLGLLTNAPSAIVHPAWSSEATGLFEATRRFGLTAVQADAGRIVVTGVGRSLLAPGDEVRLAGSAFNFRTVAALAALVPGGDTLLVGNASMRARPVLRHLGFIEDLGGRVEDVSDAGQLRLRVRGGARFGGATTVDTRHSSQVLTAVLLVSPLADDPVTVRCDGPGELVGAGYVDLTLAMMRDQGAVVERDGTSFRVEPGSYQSVLHHVASDFTALSYLAGAVATAPDGDITVDGYQPSALSSEREFLEVLATLGIRTSHDPVTGRLRVRRADPAAADIEIDGRNIPTVVPTLAAICPFIDARITVRNVAHVNNHKSRRVEAMVAELERMGCRITSWYDRDGALNAFRTVGRQSPAGDAVLDGHGDHRVFLSLATAALGARRPTVVDGAEHLPDSFPDYLQVMTSLGARMAPTDSRSDRGFPPVQAPARASGSGTEG